MTHLFQVLKPQQPINLEEKRDGIVNHLFRDRISHYFIEKKSWVNNDSQKDTSLANLKRSKDAIDIPKNPVISDIFISV